MQPYYNYQPYGANAQPYQTPYIQRQPVGQGNLQLQPQQPITAPQGAPNGSPQTIVAYVNGIEGAKGYILYPNQTAILFDSDNKERFYVKTADGQGIPTVESYKKIKDEPDKKPEEQKVEYVTKADFDDLKNYTKEKIQKISEILGQRQAQQAVQTVKKEVGTI